MLENKKTIIYVGVAVVLLLLAFITSPKKLTSEAFMDQGEPFFPDFVDPNEATTLEVIGYDETTASAAPFKVTFDGGRWTIPSHHDYPADGKDRLARTAAGVIGIRKDDFRSSNVSDHEALGVVDPLDEAAGLTGRGQRVTIKGSGDQVLADFIIGNEVGRRDKFRFVRVPDQNRVYAARVDIDLCTRFEDWIETNLLDVQKYRVKKVLIKDYSINERTRSVDRRDELTLTKKDDTWKAKKMPSGRVIDSTKMQEMLTALEELKIVGVRPKPAGLSASLTETSETQKVAQSDLFSLQSKGYFFSRDGQLLSNEGEMQAFTKDGVKYTLRFGEVAYGTGEALTAGADSTQDVSGPAENRYLFVTAEFDPSMLGKKPTPPADKSYEKKPDSTWTDEDRSNRLKQDAYAKWERDMESGKTMAAELNARFAKWYYVISAESYEKLRVTRNEMVVKPESSEG